MRNGLWLLIMAFGLVAQEKKIALAVLDFQSTGGLTNNEVSTLANRFRGILVNTQKFDVIERNKMNDLLKQQNFNLSDNCNSAECAVQIGQLLGVEQMIAGDLGKLGETWTIDLRLIDVETGKILSTKSQDFKGEIDGMLKIMQGIANQFAGIETQFVPPVVDKYGDVYIISTPTNADIMIDGKSTEWKTPRLIEGLKVGKHIVDLRLGLSSAQKEIEIVENGLQNYEIRLEAPGLPVKFFSDPSAANIFVDEEMRGTTPSILKIPIGAHAVRLSLDGHEDYRYSLNVQEGASNNVTAVLSKRIIPVKKDVVKKELPGKRSIPEASQSTNSNSGTFWLVMVVVGLGGGGYLAYKGLKKETPDGTAAGVIIPPVWPPQ